MTSVENTAWHRNGLVRPRSPHGDGSEVVGDPCIVWDDRAAAWRMFLFYDPPGHASSLAQTAHPGAGDWGPAEVLRFTNPEQLPGGTHKPWVVMDAYRPNRAALVDGRYWLLTVSYSEGVRDKRVQRAWARTLAGPWTLEPDDLIPLGEGADFDAQHVDAVSGYWFDDMDMFAYFYMGYPLQPQPQNPLSPLGSSIGLATQLRTDPSVLKHGVIIPPSATPGHWASGWLGGIQIFPGVNHRWVAVLNASPTAPDHSGALTSEEPAPSLGGFAHTDSKVPFQGWRLAERPIEWVHDIPQSAADTGEGTNLWRQHILVVDDRAELFYNSGFYGQEQLFSKTTSTAAVNIAPAPAPN